MISIGAASSAGSTVNIAQRGGSFDVWQRLLGTGGTTIAQAASTTAYVNDGWYLVTGANQAATVTQATGIATGSLFAAKVQRNSGQTGTGAILYAMPLDSDEIALLQGSFVALSFTLKEGANQSFSHTVTCTLYAGTGASPAKRGSTPYTGDSSVVAVTATTTTSAARFSGTSAAVFPTNALQAEIQFSITPSGTAGADDSFTVDDLQLEIVSAATSPASAFAKTDLAEQFTRAVRHFRAIGGSTSARYGAARTTSTTNGELIMYLVTPMRVAPTVTVNNVTNWVINDASVNAAASTVASTLTVPDAVNVNLTCAAVTANRPAFFNSNNANATMFFSSEI